MSGEVVTQTSKRTRRLLREDVPEIVKVLRECADKGARSWNIVEVLELLIDAGQFTEALELSRRVIGMVAGDGRERLFEGYEALCSLMSEGSQTECIGRLEKLYVEIHNSGHSVADRVRIGLLVARGLALCVGLGSMSQAALLRARNLLGVELERVAPTDDAELYSQVALELAKTYLHAPIPDARGAHSILAPLQQEVLRRGVSSSRLFDLRRVEYQAAKLMGIESVEAGSDEALRGDALQLGEIAQALAELAIARRSDDIEVAKLEQTAVVLEEYESLSGAYEAVFLLATTALERGHNVVAERHFHRALLLATRGGFLNGVLMARVGLFQSSSIADNQEELRVQCVALVADLRSELALGSSGLNGAAAQQVVGDWSGALKTAKRCQQLFARQGLFGFESQALSIIGTCEAQRGKWQRAKAAWARAMELDEQRYAFIQASERRGLIVQALVMDDMTKLGYVRESTAKKAHILLNEADKCTKECGEHLEANQARARVRSIHAQLCVMTKRHVEALRHLSTARALFESLGMSFDVAMTDAFTGLSLMEVGKASTPDILEEAVLTMQRAQQFFSSPAYPPIRWKLSYYLAMTAIHISNSAGDPSAKMKWRDLAAGWVRTAEQDLAIMAGREGDLSPYVPTAGSDFAPGLKPSALEALQRALGFKRRGATRDKEELAEKVAVPGDGFVH